MFDPETIKVEFTIWLDGPMGRCQIGWAVYDGSDQELVEMEVLRTVDLDAGITQAVERLSEVLPRHRSRVAPF